jgi:hypothetical protein
VTISERALGFPDNRADAVRARRARKTRQVERAGRIEAPKSRRKRTPRRRYNVTLSAERGTEMQFTAIPAGSVGTRTVALVIMILAIGSLLRFSRSDRFVVDQISVDGMTMLTAAQVRSLAGVEGKSIFFLDPAVIVRLLEDAAEVKSAEINDGVAYVKHGENHGLIQINSQETSLQVGEDALTPVVNPTLMKTVASLSKHLPEVQSWDFDLDHGLGFVDGNGWQVYFGTSGDIPMKVRIYRSIAEKLIVDNVQITMVSVEDQSAPYYTVR